MPHSVGALSRILKTHVLPKFGKFFKNAFSTKYLLATNLTLSISLSGLGDIIEQKYELSCAEIDKMSYRRCGNMCASGLTLGLVCHYWYRYLDVFLPGYTLKITLKKLLLDQLIASPLCIVTFFGTIGYLEGASTEQFIEEVKQKSTRLYVADWMVWPPAQFINFYLLPSQYRVLFDNAVSLGYDVYTSRVKHDEKSHLNKSL